MNSDRVVAIWRWALRALPVAMVLSAITGCTADGFVVTGELIDGETGKPIPNAWVHQEWQLDPAFTLTLGMHGGTSGPQTCRAEQVTKTDKDGKFHFAPPENLNNYNPLRLQAKAYVSPLIPGYERDTTKSKNPGGAHQVVVAKKYAEFQTREGYVLGMTGFLSGGGRCVKIGEPWPFLSAEMSDEAARDLMANRVTLEELREVLRKDLSKYWRRSVAPNEVDSVNSFIMYQRYLERIGAPK